MKLVCDGLDLSDAILKVSKGTSNKTINPILEGIKLTAEEDILTLTATDLEMSIEKKIRADIKIEGETVVPGKFFSEYIKKLNNEQIELELDEKNILSIRYTDSIGKILCLKANEFPDIKEIEYENSFEISKKNLKNLINQCIYAVAVDDNRPILKGCKLEVEGDKITAVALDGYRLALSTKIISNTTTPFNIIVPAKSLKEISTLLDDSEEKVKVFVQKNHLMIEIDNTKIATRLLEGDFINYKQIIPSNFTSTVVLNKAQLENAIERASLLSKIDKNNLVKFDISENIMVLTSNSEIGDIKENITVSLKGKDLVIAFNARYFADALRSINEEYINLNFTTSIAPCVIKGNNDDNFLDLILPVRVM